MTTLFVLTWGRKLYMVAIIVDRAVLARCYAGDAGVNISPLGFFRGANLTNIQGKDELVKKTHSLQYH